MSTEPENSAPRRGRPRKNPIDSVAAPPKATSKAEPKSELKQATIDHVEPIEVVQETVAASLENVQETGGDMLLSFAPEIVADPVFEQEPPPAGELAAEVPNLFLVYRDKAVLGVVEEGSEAHLFVEQKIAEQMRQWVEEAKAPLNDRGLLSLNVGRHARSYSSWSAYFAQNGLAPQQPKYLTKMDYWRSQADASLTDEEIVALFIGKDFTYHVVPVRRLEQAS